MFWPEAGPGDSCSTWAAWVPSSAVTGQTRCAQCSLTLAVWQELFEAALRIEPAHPDALAAYGAVLHALQAASPSRSRQRQPPYAHVRTVRGCSLPLLDTHAETADTAFDTLLCAQPASLHSAQPPQCAVVAMRTSTRTDHSVGHLSLFLSLSLSFSLFLSLSLTLSRSLSHSLPPSLSPTHSLPPLSLYRARARILRSSAVCDSVVRHP